MLTLAQIIYEETGLTESGTPDEYRKVEFACNRFAAHVIFANSNTDDTALLLLRQALEALEHAEKDVADFQRLNTDQTGAAIAALRDRLGVSGD